MLCHEKILRKPLLYLSLYFKQHRDEYFDLLTRVREAGDWEAWLAFFSPYLSKTTLISPPTVDAVLKALQDKRIIREITGRKRRRLYAYVKYLEIMSKGTELRADEVWN